MSMRAAPFGFAVANEIEPLIIRHAMCGSAGPCIDVVVGTETRSKSCLRLAVRVDATKVTGEWLSTLRYASVTKTKAQLREAIVPFM